MRFVADFIGESTDAAAQSARTSPGASVLRRDTADLADDAGGRQRRGLDYWSLRPERLRVLDGSETETTLNRLAGTVSDLVYQGDSFLLYVRLANGAEVAVRGVTRRDRLAALPRPDEVVTLGIDAADTVLIADNDD